MSGTDWVYKCSSGIEYCEHFRSYCCSHQLSRYRHVHIHLHIHLHIHIHIHILLRIHIHMHLHLHIHSPTYTPTHTHKPAYAYTYTYTCIIILILICIFVFTHVFVYISTYLCYQLSRLSYYFTSYPLYFAPFNYAFINTIYYPNVIIGLPIIIEIDEWI